VRKVLLGVSVFVALGCGGGDEGTTATTASTAPPTTLISFSEWQAATNAVCTQYGPIVEQFEATADFSTLESSTAAMSGLTALQMEFTAALRAIPVPTDRETDVRRTNHLWTTTDQLLAEASFSLAGGDFTAFDLTLAEYFERFAEAEDLLVDLDIPAC
jgi:hypothetical protein